MVSVPCASAAQPARSPPRRAPAVAPASGPRRSRSLAAEVRERERQRAKRAPGPPAIAAHWREGGEAQRRRRRGQAGTPGEGPAARVHGISREQRRERLDGAVAPLLADDGVAGLGHDEQVGARDRGRHGARVGGGRAQVFGTAEDQRRHARQRGRHGGRGGARVGPRGARLEVAGFERGRVGEGIERDAGTARATPSASATRLAGGDERLQGNCSSSQVAAK